MLRWMYDKAGFMENGKCQATDLGVPQGGTISTTLALMALSGLEGKLVSTRKRQRDKDKIRVVSYADDFVVGLRFQPVSSVPVPAALPLMATAIGLFGLQRRRNAKA